jgi:hypothetical protein
LYGRATLSLFIDWRKTGSRESLTNGQTRRWPLLPEIRCCKISKEMLALYFGLAVFYLFEARVPEYDTQPPPPPGSCRSVHGGGTLVSNKEKYTKPKNTTTSSLCWSSKISSLSLPLCNSGDYYTDLGTSIEDDMSPFLLYIFNVFASIHHSPQMSSSYGPRVLNIFAEQRTERDNTNKCISDKPEMFQDSPAACTL